MTDIRKTSDQINLLKGGKPKSTKRNEKKKSWEEMRAAGYVHQEDGPTCQLIPRKKSPTQKLFGRANRWRNAQDQKNQEKKKNKEMT